MRRLFLAVLLCALPVSLLGQDFRPAPQKKKVRAERDATLRDIERLAGLAVVAKAKDVMLGLVRSGVAHSTMTSEAARDLYLLTPPPYEEMLAYLKGKKPSLSVKKTVSAAAEDTAAQKKRWQRLRDKLRELQSRKGPGPGGKRKENLKKAAADLDRAQRLLDKADRKAKDLRRSGGKLERGAQHAGEAKDELDRASTDVGTDSGRLDEAGQEAVRRIMALGGKPSNEIRGRAMQSIAPLRDRVLEVRAAADRALNRSQDFEGHVDAFVREKRRFESLRKEIPSRTKDIRDLLDNAERIFQETAKKDKEAAKAAEKDKKKP